MNFMFKANVSETLVMMFIIHYILKSRSDFFFHLGVIKIMNNVEEYIVHISNIAQQVT